MRPLYLLEPAPDRTWAPFDGARPLAELRAGAWLVRERWEASTGSVTAAVLSDRLAGFVDVGSAPVTALQPIAGPALVACSDFVPERRGLSPAAGTRRLTCAGRSVAWIVGKDEKWRGPDDAGPAEEISGFRLAGPWDLVEALERLLPSDCLEFVGVGGDPVPDGCIVLGDPTHVVCLGADVEPGTVFDTRHGAVVLAEGVTARSGTRLEGPLYAAPGTRFLGGQVRHSAFGPECRVHGEVSSSVFTGFANKAHDGFLGHSVVGTWVNLGAGTITSNLKNTYGDIRVATEDGQLPTGRQFLGSLIGDHAKTAIGTLLGTGTVVGTGANVFGLPVPRWLPAFSWGSEGRARQDAEGFIRTVRRVLPRRNQTLTPAWEQALRAMHARLA